MPASIRIAGIGCIVKVSGRRIEIAERAPNPGSTPMRFPTSTPTKDHSRLCGCRATSKPFSRSASDCSIMWFPGEELEGHLERPPEDHDADHDHREREQGRL